MLRLVGNRMEISFDAQVPLCVGVQQSISSHRVLRLDCKFFAFRHPEWPCLLSRCEGYRRCISHESRFGKRIEFLNVGKTVLLHAGKRS
jgi:hypothetical protein